MRENDDKTFLKIDEAVEYLMKNWNTVFAGSTDKLANRNALESLQNAVEVEKYKVLCEIVARTLSEDPQISEDLEELQKTLHNKYAIAKQKLAEYEEKKFDPDSTIPESLQLPKYEQELEARRQEVRQAEREVERVEHLYKIYKINDKDAFISEMVNKLTGFEQIAGAIINQSLYGDTSKEVFGVDLMHKIPQSSQNSTERYVFDYERIETLLDIVKDPNLLSELVEGTEKVQKKGLETGYDSLLREKADLNKEIKFEEECVKKAPTLASVIEKTVQSAMTMMEIDERRSQRALMPQSGLMAWFNQTFRKKKMQRIAEEAEIDNRNYDDAKRNLSSILHALDPKGFNNYDGEMSTILEDFAKTANVEHQEMKDESPEAKDKLDRIMKLISSQDKNFEWYKAGYTTFNNLEAVVRMYLNSEDRAKTGDQLIYESTSTHTKKLDTATMHLDSVETNIELKKPEIENFNESIIEGMSPKAKAAVKQGFFLKPIKIINKALKDSPDKLVPILVLGKLMQNKGIKDFESAEKAGFDLTQEQIAGKVDVGKCSLMDYINYLKENEQEVK